MGTLSAAETNQDFATEAELFRGDYEQIRREHQHDGRMIREVLERVGDKWSLLVIGSLQNEPLRFTALQQHIPGISQRMLTRTVRLLERDGLITRTVYPQVPPRVEYGLTALGQTLLVPALALSKWAVTNQEAVRASRSRYDQAVSE